MDSCPILLTFSRVLQLEVQVDVHGLDSSIAGHDVFIGTVIRETKRT